MSSPARKLSDEQLQFELRQVNAAKQDPKDFRALYDKYYHPIFVFIHKRTDDEHLTADLSSQVFMKAMKNIQKYEYRGFPFSAWLYRIAINEVNEFYRKNSRARVVSFEQHHARDLVEEMDDGEKEEKEKLLKETIQFLSPDEVQLLELRYFEKKPFKEVGEILDITENNAKIRVHRLLKKMKKLMLDKLKSES